jgi:hypothetical protein
VLVFVGLAWLLHGLLHRGERSDNLKTCRGGNIGAVCVWRVSAFSFATWGPLDPSSDLDDEFSKSFVVEIGAETGCFSFHFVTSPSPWIISGGLCLFKLCRGFDDDGRRRFGC